MNQEAEKNKKETTTDSQVIGIRLPNEIASAIKQEAARRNIRLNRLILELWENYQQGQKGS